MPILSESLLHPCLTTFLKNHGISVRLLMIVGFADSDDDEEKDDDDVTVEEPICIEENGVCAADDDCCGDLECEMSSSSSGK